MPAINPDQLRKESYHLMEYFDNPVLFTRNLYHLLESYAENIHRPGQTRIQTPIIPSFKVKPTVLKILIKDISPLVNQNPTKALDLCDHLWEVPYFEVRIIAAMVLGKINLSPINPILIRIHSWIQKDTEELLINGILTYGLDTLRNQHSEVFYNLIDEWLSGKDVFFQKIGLRALFTYVENIKIENFPIIFRLVQPYCRKLPTILSPELTDLMRILAKQSPNETTYFLLQTMRLPDSPDTSWLIRQIMSTLPSSQQTELRTAIKELKFQSQM